MTSNSNSLGSHDFEGLVMTAKFSKISEIPSGQRPRGSMPEGVFDLTPGRPYLIVAMALWERVLNVLTQDDYGVPSLIPAAMFEQGQWEIPRSWLVRTLGGLNVEGSAHWANPTDALWGYEDFVMNRGYSNRLFEDEPLERDNFNRRYSHWLESRRRSS